ncbi:MAG TPA: NAD-dependent succinate-semialdehyde dehydrogenase [Pseudonocardiaceae bacterium]|jgi:succinate-semialdehyde dehydrogenase/glutarate-semialdehyde dehydrogenase|nr:NAD-dependent succinate-semialdehyde dehydrogenase [Pseudonocardiaceae bacterium]
MTTVTGTAVDYPDPRLLVDGRWRGSAAGSPVVDPATEQVIAEVPHATTDDIDAALAAAARGFETWRRTPVAERAAVMREAARLVRARADRFARVITLELGKPLAEARVEVGTAVGILEWNADEGRRTYGRVIPGPANRRQFVQAEPIGPVAAFAPWNAPLITPSRKISSALAAGCSVVIKPAEETPGTAVLLAQAYLDAGLPAGVLGVLFGEPARISERLLTSDVIRAVTFTGSTAVGRQLAGTAALHMKRAVMELGGHAPVLVCEDVSPEQVAAGAAKAAYRNAGQVCTSPTRFFVARSRYAEFLDALTDRVRALKLGNGFDAGTDIGPVAGERRLTAVDRLVADAVRHGARVTTGGRRREGTGYFYEPTVLADVGDDCEVSRVEPFGPLATVAAYDDLDTAIRRANSVPFGLAGYVFGNDAATVRRLGAELDCGAIAVNHWQVSGPETPFGGHRDSGFGSEGGIEGISAFQQLKFLSEQ